MAYSIKTNKKASIGSIAKHARLCYAYLEIESQIVYGSSYSQLSLKEQKVISMRVAKQYPFSLREVD